MSTLERLPEEVGRAWERWVMRAGRRWAWLVPGLVAGVCVYVSYLLTHTYPAFGAGLFLAMSERLTATFPALPATVPHYTARGVPFAYPPLMFAVTGLLLEVPGIDGVAVTRHLPHVVSIAALVPLYLFAEELLGSRRGAGLTTLLAATAPPLLQWQISAGGIVRAPAYLFTVVGLYAGLRLFAGGDRRWLAPALVAFALTVLTHPVYTVFFVLSYLTMYAAFDATAAGLRRGMVVGLGGALLSSPWWGQVVATHGVDVLTGAAGTHGGIGKRLPDLLRLFTGPEGSHAQGILFAIQPELFDFSTVGMGVLTVWSLAIVAAWIVLLLVNRRLSFLPGWALLSIVFVSKPRFSFLIGAVMVGTVLDRHALPAVDFRGERATALARVAVGVLLVSAATTTGVLYAGSQLDTHAGSTAQPAFLDHEDVDAMDWVVSNTDPGSTFVVLGDNAEWFPYRTDRTMLVGPWGVEWRGRQRYQAQLSAFNRLSTCESAGCLSVHLDQQGISPDYVYVPKGRYTVRGMELTTARGMERSLASSDRYRLVYENPGVLVFEYDLARSPAAWKTVGAPASLPADPDVRRQQAGPAPVSDAVTPPGTAAERPPAGADDVAPATGARTTSPATDERGPERPTVRL